MIGQGAGAIIRFRIIVVGADDGSGRSIADTHEKGWRMKLNEVTMLSLQIDNTESIEKPR